MNYTLKKIPVNVGFFVKIQATVVPLVEKTGTKYVLFFRLTSLFSNCTLKNKIQVSMLFSVTFIYLWAAALKTIIDE